MNEQKPMIIFDLDGTLWDSSRQVAESWNLVFQKYRDSDPAASAMSELCAQDIRNVMGKTMEEIAMILMPDAKPSVRSRLFGECETFEVDYITEHGGILYPHVKDTLSKLIQEGYSLSIVSNCQTDYVKAFLVSMNMNRFFCDYEEWGRTGKSKGDNIRLVMERNQVQKAVYVGDTKKDAEAAYDAGIPFIWASYGFGNVEKYDAELTAFSLLPAVIKNILDDTDVQ